MKSYKKRAKAGWQTGKHEKEIANSSERMYAKKEVFQEMKEAIEGDDFRYKTPSKKNLTKEQKIKRKIQWYESRLEYWKRPNISSRPYCLLMSGLVSSFESALKKLKQQLEELNSAKEKDIECI